MIWIEELTPLTPAHWDKLMKFNERVSLHNLKRYNLMGKYRKEHADMLTVKGNYTGSEPDARCVTCKLRNLNGDPSTPGRSPHCTLEGFRHKLPPLAQACSAYIGVYRHFKPTR